MDILAFDTETTGLPIWKEPSDSEGQPHIVEIAALLYSPSGDLVDEFSALVKPDGWTISQEMTDIHGITQEQAMDEGIPEAEALAGYLALHDRAGLRVGHNVSFDDRILRIAIKRYGAGATQEERDALADLYKAGESYCTCWTNKPVLAIPGPRGHKLPTLAEAYEHYFGTAPEVAHRARADAEACAKVYFAMQART
jgi:DNA polymerase III subunit epsilon